MTATDLLHRFSDLMDRQMTAGEALLAALDAEKHALTGTDVEALNYSTTLKQAEMLRVETLERERQQLCNTHGIGLRGTDMEQTLARMGGDQVSAHWRQVARLLGRCRDANETNGLIVQYKQRQMLQLLSLLRGSNNAATTYSAAGATAVPMGTRALGQV